MDYRRCSQCHKARSLSAFHRWNRGKEGYRVACKDCRNAKSKLYREKNHEKVLKGKKRYREENKNKIKIKSRKYYLENKEHLNTQSREYYNTHRKSIRSRTIKFKNRSICLTFAPRTNTCTKCRKSYPEELRIQTIMHHTEYDEEQPLAHTIELCLSCHSKLHTQLKKQAKLEAHRRA